jgi:LssY-like putative type I secretion system component LssY
MAPYVEGGKFSLPVGSIVEGSVLSVASKQRESLRLRFDSVQIGDRKLNFEAHVSEVDNARERVLPDGTVVALDPIPRKPGRIELVLLAAAHAHPMALTLIETTKLTMHELERPQVHYPEGTDMRLAVDKPPAISESSPERPEAVASNDLARIFEDLPSRTRAKRPAVPSDWVNLAFLGSRTGLVQAFAAAGWQTADQLSLRTEAKTFFAVADHHGYQTAPVSTLLVSGREPDLVFQKQLNTFAKRHHIRIWATDPTWDGQPVWIAAATHDIGIDFSREAKTFSHKVESNIDLERSRVIDDLGFVNRLDKVWYIPRTSVPQESTNATGDHLRTDGRLAVGLLRP